MDALAGVIVGAIVGYVFRASEFRRAQRLKVYGEFVGAFLEVARHGAILGSSAL
jgi:hypothetical protein